MDTVFGITKNGIKGQKMKKITCKWCGAPNFASTFTEELFCEYCGHLVCKGDNKERIIHLYAEAFDAQNRKDFDKAQHIYEQIIDMDATQSEAHWGVTLCRYGVEFVQDPCSGKMIPICRCINNTSILEDKNYLAAIEYADSKTRAQYENIALGLDDVFRRAINIITKERPFDVFICYKRVDYCGKKTIDSFYARGLYDYLTGKGLKVFFAEETLKTHAGNMYEPYILAAVTSAKVMVLMGSCREHFEAVWVKNEWQRFLAQAEEKLSKSLLPVCIKCRPEETLSLSLRQMQALDADDFVFKERLYDTIKKKICATLQPEQSNFADMISCDKKCAQSIQSDTEIGEKTYLVLRSICDQFGAEIIQNGSRALAYFSDLAPELKKEKRMLMYFFECKGNSQLLGAMQNDPAAIKIALQKVVRQMSEELMVDAEASQSIAEAFLKVISENVNAS